MRRWEPTQLFTINRAGSVGIRQAVSMTQRMLVLLRHAKAENPLGVADADRPLSDRGLRDARAAGRWLAKQMVPELVLCSPARRTRQTWQAVAEQLPAEVVPQVRYEPDLYRANVSEVVQLLQQIDDDVTRVLVVGHNPTLSYLAYTLANGADSAVSLDSDGLRTSGLAVHEFTGSWAHCGPGAAGLAATHTARAELA